MIGRTFPDRPWNAQPCRCAHPKSDHVKSRVKAGGFAYKRCKRLCDCAQYDPNTN